LQKSQWGSQVRGGAATASFVASPPTSFFFSGKHVATTLDEALQWGKIYKAQQISHWKLSDLVSKASALPQLERLLADRAQKLEVYFEVPHHARPERNFILNKLLKLAEGQSADINFLENGQVGGNAPTDAQVLMHVFQVYWNTEVLGQRPGIQFTRLHSRQS